MPLGLIEILQESTDARPKSYTLNEADLQRVKKNSAFFGKISDTDWEGESEVDCSQLGELFYSNNHLKKLVREGIPNNLRRDLWQLWSGSRFKLKLWPGHYQDILQYYEGQPSTAITEIEKVIQFHELIQLKIITK